ncbi:MAG TPA: hypothetical protein VF491_20400, partial [Vicinamibacterales bacterium]
MTTTYLTFGLLLAAVLGLWINRTFWMAALAAAVLCGILTGALHWLAAVWIAILAVLAWVYVKVRGNPALPNKALWQTLTGLLFAIYAVAMSLALLPGFHRVVLVEPQVLSPGAAPYGISV